MLKILRHTQKQKQNYREDITYLVTNGHLIVLIIICLFGKQIHKIKQSDLILPFINTRFNSFNKKVDSFAHKRYYIILLYY